MWHDSISTWGLLVALSLVSIAESGQLKRNTREASGFQCKEEGYHEDPQDCTIYYRCVNWGNGSPLTKFKFECGPGTVFSKAHGDVCVHPNESERKECGNTNDEDDKTNDVDLNNTYEPEKENAANGGKPVPGPPPHGSPPQGPSYVPPSTGTGSAGNKPGSVSGGQGGSTSNEGGINQATNKPTSGPQCQSEGFLEDPDDCSKFYRCVYEGSDRYRRYEYTCGVGTVWDSKAETCNHPWAAKREGCKGSTGAGPVSGSNPSGSGNSHFPASTPDPNNPNPPGPPCQTETPPTNGGGSNYPGSSGGLDGSDVFIPVEQEHPQGGPSGPGNEVQQTQAPESQSPPPSNPASPDNGSQQPDNSPEPQGPPPSNPASPDNGSQQQPGGQPSSPSSGACTSAGFFGDPNDCRKFYRCVGSRPPYQKFDFVCGEGTAWDERITNCNHIYNVPGCNGASPGASGPASGEGAQYPDSNEIGQGPAAGPESSTSAIPSDSATPLDTDALATEQPSQDSSTQATTDSPIETGNVPLKPATPLDTDALATQQPPQDSSTQATTDNPIETGNAPVQPAPGTGANPPDNSSPNQTPSPTYLPPSGPQGPPSSSGGPLTGDCTSEGFFSDPNNCKKFYRCVGESGKYTKYEFDCPEGTGWDDKIQTCNYDYLVPNCGGQSGATPGPSTGSSNVPSEGSSSATPPPTESTENKPTESTEGKPTETSENKPTETPETESTETPENKPTEGPPTSSSSEEPAGETPEGSSSSPPTEGSSGDGPAVDSSANGPESESGNGPSTETSEVPPAEGSSSSEPTESSTDSNEATTSSPEVSSSPSDPPTESATPVLATSEEVLDSSPPTTIPPDASSAGEPQTETPESTDSNAIPDEAAVSSTTATPSEPANSPTTTNAPVTESTTAGQQPSKPPSSNNEKCTEPGFFPNKNDCKKFYRCVGVGPNSYTKYEFDCAPGTAWDQRILTCNYIAQVPTCSGDDNNEVLPEKDNNDQGDGNSGSSSTENVSGGQETSSPSSGITMEPESSSESSSSSSSSSSSEESSGSSSEPCDKPSKPAGNNGIVCEKEGFYANPRYCGKFYRCEDNGNGFNVHYFDCPPGTIFDPSISVCNYPHSVYPARDCDDGGSGSSAGTAKPGSSSTSQGSPTTGKPDKSEGAAAEGESTPEEVTTTSSEETTTGSSETNDTSTESSENNESTSGEQAETTPGETEPTTESSAATEEQETTGSEESPATTETGSTEAETSPESTEASEATETESTSQETTIAPNEVSVTACPIGNITGEQIVLVCPTGFKRHPKYCNIFYQCVSQSNMDVKILTFTCPDDTIFDEEKIQCVAEGESSQPCTGVKASARLIRSTQSSSTSLMKVEQRETLCPGVGHYPYRQGCSNVFYKCSRDSRNTLQGYLYKCPENFGYWSVSRRCERATRLPMCSHLLPSAEGSANSTWYERWQLPTESVNLSARMLRYR